MGARERTRDEGDRVADLAVACGAADEHEVTPLHGRGRDGEEDGRSRGAGGGRAEQARRHEHGRKTSTHSTRERTEWADAGS